MKHFIRTLVAILLLVVIIAGTVGCIPQRELLPTMAPTSEPDKNKVHNIELVVKTEEGGKAILNTNQVKYDDVAELTVQCEDGYVVKSVKAGESVIFLNDNIGYITDVIDDITVTVAFSEKKETTSEEVVPGSITTAFYNKDATEYGITWHTQKSGTPVVKYIKAEGQNPESADFTNATIITAYSEYTAANYKNYATIENLEFDTEYFYICGDAEHDVYSEVYSFTTRKEDQKDVTFLHFSDTQDTSYNGEIWAAGLKHAFDTYKDTNFVIHTGDIVQEGGVEEQWNFMLGNAAPYLKNSVLMGVAGNHDYWEAYLHYATKCTLSHFNIELTGQNTINGMYYSFDYGDAHFVVLNTGDTMETGNTGLTSGQVKWLKEDLLSTDKKWKIVAMHNPLYSPGKYGSDPGYNTVAKYLRNQLNGIFSQCGVDLVLTGHDHVYSCTHPITAAGEPIKGTKTKSENGVEYLIEPQGPVHLASGVAGHQVRGVMETEKDMFKDMMATKDGNCYYSAISVKDGKMTVEFYGVDLESGEGKVLYSWGIIK